MSKLNVNITAEGKVGRIEIIGAISDWTTNNSSDLRVRCNALKDSGVTSCNVYIMTIGGECFEANEIVNILNELFGSYTAEGGALVASAGTYIAINATKFTMAKNGQFMVHKPSGGVSGNESEMESYLNLLKGLTKTYYSAYVSKLKKTEDEFKAKWESGDFWMTAQEAFEWGFVQEVREQQTAVSNKSEKQITAYLQEFYKQNNQKPNNEMSKLITLLVAALALEGITENSTEEQVVSAVQSKFNVLNGKIATLESAAKAETDKLIKSMLDKAQADGKLVAAAGKKVEDVRATYENVGKTSGVEALATILDGLQTPASIVAQIDKGAPAATGEIKTFNDLLAKGEDYIKTFKAEQKAEYDKLYKAEFGHNPNV